MDKCDKVDIWNVSIFAAKPYLNEFFPMLSEEEKERGDRLLNPEHRLRFLLSHGVLRSILSDYLNQLPATISFTKGEHGKPYIAFSGLHFNMSHSLDRVLIAVSWNKEIGVDVENVGRDHSFDQLVARFFAKKEQDQYFSYSSPEERRLAFYRGWTRKEAYLKAIGAGLSHPLEDFVVSLDPGELHGLLEVRGDAISRSQWILSSVEINSDYIAAIAVNDPSACIRTRLWSF